MLWGRCDGLLPHDNVVFTIPCQTTAMAGVVHPFAGAGGGHLFEYKVATLLAADLVLSRHTEHGGVVAAIEMQTGPAGFEDLQVSVELLGGGNRTVHVQCRYRQPFTVSNVKFAKLIAQAAAAACSDDSFATEEKRLAVILDSGSPGHASMTKLSELARDPGDFDRFVSVVEAHGGSLESRWKHCLGTAGALEPELLHRVLAVLEVRTVALRTETSRDSVELVNRLADAWTPRDLGRAMNLGNALFKLLTDIGPMAGMIDLSYLQSRLSAYLPSTLGATTRRARLGRRRKGGHRRIAMTMKAVGLDDEEAETLATRALATPPSITISEDLTVVSGAMGVGKTTELERIHRVAIDRRLADPNAPIPVFLQASEVANSSLVAAASVQADDLDDPSRVGVHLIIDGLDEAGVQIADLTLRIATLQADWPHSTVIVGTRPQSTPPGLETVVVEALTADAAESLMAAIHPGVASLKWLREELTEVLCRPLFAIRFALDHRQGNLAGSSQGQLIGSVGRQALDDIGDTTDDAFDLLVRLACSVVDSGGRPVDVRSLEATPVQVVQLMRSRIVQVVDGNASFQLAAVTEWFAADALLRDSSMLTRSVSSASRAHRWRYVFVQALLQGSADEVDTVMSTLLASAPATAAWVHHEAQPPRLERRSTPLAASVQEAGARIRRAARAWAEPWSDLIGWFPDGGEPPTLGIAMGDQRLTTAWLSRSEDTLDRVVPLPPDVHPLANTNSPWTGAKTGSPSNGENWSWDWMRDQFQRTIDGYFRDRDLLADIDLCWPELAWDFAHHMLRLRATVQSKPVQRADLEAAISKYRALTGTGEVYIGRRGGDWSLTEGEAFVADLARLGISEVRPPWPPANARGKWTWSWWTTEQLLARLQLATKTALDVYQAIVDRHLPTMAPELHTYQLLPGRIVGLLTPADPDKGYEGAPRYRWRIEPQPTDSPNEALWSVCNTDDPLPDDEWESRNAQVRTMRGGDLAERIPLYTHYGEPQIYSSTPAGFLALKLLGRDLSAFKWITGPSAHHANARSVRPRYTAKLKSSQPWD